MCHTLIDSAIFSFIVTNVRQICSSLHLPGHVYLFQLNVPEHIRMNVACYLQQLQYGLRQKPGAKKYVEELLEKKFTDSFVNKVGSGKLPINIIKKTTYSISSCSQLYMYLDLGFPRIK